MKFDNLGGVRRIMDYLPLHIWLVPSHSQGFGLMSTPLPAPPHPALDSTLSRAGSRRGSVMAERGAIPGHGGASRDIVLGLGGLHLLSVSMRYEKASWARPYRFATLADASILSEIDPDGVECRSRRPSKRCSSLCIHIYIGQN